MTDELREKALKSMDNCYLVVGIHRDKLAIPRALREKIADQIINIVREALKESK